MTTTLFLRSTRVTSLLYRINHICTNPKVNEFLLTRRVREIQRKNHDYEIGLIFFQITSSLRHSHNLSRSILLKTRSCRRNRPRSPWSALNLFRPALLPQNQKRTSSRRNPIAAVEHDMRTAIIDIIEESRRCLSLPLATRFARSGIGS